MAHPEETRNKVRTAYVRGRMSIQDAALHVGISEATAKSWRAKAKGEGDDWDMARSAARMAAGGLGDMTTEVLEDFILQFKRSMEELRKDAELGAAERAEVLSRLSDAYVKTMRAASASNNNLARLSVALEVLELLGQFIQTKYAHHASAFVELLEPFGVELGKHYG